MIWLLWRVLGVAKCCMFYFYQCNIPNLTEKDSNGERHFMIVNFRSLNGTPYKFYQISWINTDTPSSLHASAPRLLGTSICIVLTHINLRCGKTRWTRVRGADGMRHVGPTALSKMSILAWHAVKPSEAEASRGVSRPAGPSQPRFTPTRRQPIGLNRVASRQASQLGSWTEGPSYNEIWRTAGQEARRGAARRLPQCPGRGTCSIKARFAVLRRAGVRLTFRVVTPRTSALRLTRTYLRGEFKSSLRRARSIESAQGNNLIVRYCQNLSLYFLENVSVE